MKSKTIPQLQAEFSAILAENKPTFLRMFAEDVMGITATVGDADFAGNMLPTGKKYIMHGFGSSITIMVGKGVKGRKYVEAAGWAINEFKEAMKPELLKLYPEAEIEPILLQDISVNDYLRNVASEWFHQNGAKAETQTFSN